MTSRRGSIPDVPRRFENGRPITAVVYQADESGHEGVFRPDPALVAQVLSREHQHAHHILQGVLLP